MVLMFLSSSLTVLAMDISDFPPLLKPPSTMEQPVYEDLYFKGKSDTYRTYSLVSTYNSVQKYFYVTQLNTGVFNSASNFYFLREEALSNIDANNKSYVYRPSVNNSAIGIATSYSYSVGSDKKTIVFGGKQTYSDATPSSYVSTNGKLIIGSNGKSPAYGEFKTTAPVFDSVEDAEKYFKNGDDSGLVNDTPELDESLIIRDLDVEENKNLGVLKSAVVTWSPSKYVNFPSANLTVEIKVDGQALNKNGSVAKDFSGEVVSASVEKKDITGSYTIDMDALKSDIVSKHGLNAANVGGLKVTDYFCRYTFNGVTFGNWQRIGDYDPNLGDATLDKSLGVVSNLNFKINKGLGFKKAIISWLPKTTSDSNLRLEACFLGRVINKQNGQITNYTKLSPIFNYSDEIKDLQGIHEFDYNKVTYKWLESLGYSSNAPVTPQMTEIVIRYMRLNDDYTYSYGLWSYFKIKHGVIIDGKFIETPLTDGIFGDDTFWVEKVDDIIIKTDKDGNTIIDDNGNDKVITDNDGNTIVDGSNVDFGNIADIFSWFIKQFNSLASSIKVVPQMLASVVTWIPGPIIVLIGIGIGIAVLLRILGR